MLKAGMQLLTDGNLHKFSMWPNMNNSLQTEKKSYRIIRRQFLVGCKSQVATH